MKSFFSLLLLLLLVRLEFTFGWRKFGYFTQTQLYKENFNPIQLAIKMIYAKSGRIARSLYVSEVQIVQY